MLTWTPHELLPVLSDEEIAQLEPRELLAIHAAREEAIHNAARDPYNYGYELPSWKRSWEMWADLRTLLLLGANRSSKSEFGAKTTVKAAIENPGSLIYCFSQNQETSLLVQQAAIYRYLPPELKKKQTSDLGYISYKAKTGFSDNSLILPNGSRIMFKFYSQFQQDPTILEGMELGSRTPKWINVGAWCDEYLGGMDLLDRLYLRLATRDAKMLITFTPKDGVTETVSNYIKDAETIESGDAPLLRELHGIQNTTVPTVQINGKKGTVIMYFHSIDNPWSGYRNIVEMCRAKNDYRYTLTAAYGVPTKSYTTKFAKFSETVNVLTAEEMNRRVFGYRKEDGEWVVPNVSRYQIIDPAGKKSWFMSWIAVDAAGTYHVYREYPGEDVGDWAEQGRNGKWVAGEGAKGQGLGLKDYIDLSMQMEGNEFIGGEWKGGEEIQERIIDPRLGSAKYQGADGESSIMQDLDDLGFVVTPAPGNDIEDGIQKVIDLMAYDTSKEIDGLNHPHFYISRDCRNIISALSEYTGDEGLKEAWKDPIDCLRYAAIAEIDHFDSKSVLVTGRGGGY